MAQQVRTALISVWLVVSAVTLVVVSASCVLPEGGLESVAAACQLPPGDRERCLLCGMTRAFVAISDGDLDRANAFNRGSVGLYGIFVGNGVLAVAFVSRRARRWCSSDRVSPSLDDPVTQNTQNTR